MSLEVGDKVMVSSSDHSYYGKIDSRAHSQYVYVELDADKHASLRANHIRVISVRRDRLKEWN